MGRSNKTISRELNRVKSQPYAASKANKDALYHRHHSTKYRKYTEVVIAHIDHFLGWGLSPEQIAGRMRLEGFEGAVSTHTIYRLIRINGWCNRLPRKGKRYRRGAPREAGASLIPERVDIDQRPAIVDTKRHVGHWEGDTVHGADGYFVTLVERVSKTFLFARVKRKTKRAVAQAIKRLLAPYKEICHTITFDNGGEFAGHRRIAQALGCRIYFAKPYHSWQRGLNENSNGLLRRYFPKKTKIGPIRKQTLDDVQLFLNF